MTANRVIDKQKLIYCGSLKNTGVLCHAVKSWERCPEMDMTKPDGSIFEYAYRCRECGAIAWYPYEPEIGYTGDITPKTPNNKISSEVK